MIGPSWRGLIPRVGEGEHPDLGGGLHVPRTLPGGVFTGERRQGTASFLVLDDGHLRPVAGRPRVDHDARVLRFSQMREEAAPDPDPPALQLEHTPERRQRRQPSRAYERDGQIVYFSDWVFFGGQETEVQERSGGVNTRWYFDRVLGYNGAESEVLRHTATQTVTLFDFRWQFSFAPSWAVPDVSPPPGYYVGEAAQRVGTRYRGVRIRRWGYDADPQPYDESHIQGHVGNLRLAGDLGVGWLNVTGFYATEVTAVRGKDRDTQGNVIATWVDAWQTLARLDTAGYGLHPPEAVPLIDPRGQVGGYVMREAPTVDQEVEVLRDTLLGEWPAPPAEPDLVFVAAGGQVQMRGAGPGGILSAFGHTFAGGSWAALRDAPLVREDGTTDWERVIVLHASDTTVTAVRQDGSTEAIPREQFEREILRVSPGAFTGFSSVGTLNNTWPPQWAWCECGRDTRAVAVHDAWRDSQKTRPQPDAVPPPGPDHWYWPARPGKRPRKAPSSAPVAPLGLTLADVAGAVLHDEPLKRREPPLLLPAEAKTGAALNVDVRAKVAKRMLYQPSEWPEELDDRTSTRGPLKLTFKLPDPPRAPSGDDPGETWEAALVLRLKTKAETIRVNGVECSLFKLGHNADQRRGWHSYVVPVPTSSAGVYGLEFEGQCSRALLCMRTMPVESSSPLPG